MRAIALVVALAVSGCSFALVKGPSTVEAEPTTWPICTEHYFWQLVDGAVAGLAFGGFVYFAKERKAGDDTAALGMVFEGGLAAGFGLSALTALGKTSRCRKARDAYEKAAEQGR